MCPDSGGWSYPKPEDKATINTLPKVQLYDLSNDPKELNNVEATQPETVKELKLLLGKYISDGRSTPGKPQKNDALKSEWKQIDFIKE